MKNILYLILSLLLSVVFVGGVMKMMQPQTSETPESTATDSTDDFWGDNSEENSTDSKDESVKEDASDSTGKEDSSETEKEEELPMLKGLKIPANEADLIEERLEMRTGAQLYVGNDVERPQLRFSCNVTKELRAEIEGNANKQLAMLLFPANGFDFVNPDKYTYIDWITALDKAGQTGYVLSYFDNNYQPNGEDYYIAFRFENIPYKQINNSIAALGVVITTNADGTKTYEYSKLPVGQTYQSNARSVAYVAAASLNAHVLGMETFTNDRLALLKSYINESVDKAVGHASATNDGSMYAFTVMPTGPKAVKVGETFALQVFVSPAVNIPIWYRSTDESILTVDDNGNVTAKAKGTAVIGVYVAGESYGVTVTVS